MEYTETPWVNESSLVSSESWAAAVPAQPIATESTSSKVATWERSKNGARSDKQSGGMDDSRGWDFHRS